jgi:tetratricopeptide (TPR) repeat protein
LTSTINGVRRHKLALVQRIIVAIAIALAIAIAIAIAEKTDKMSGKEGEEADVCCANCGITEIDDLKLEDCGGCDLVKYCSDKCREEHREQHDEECNIRAAILHDNKLFTEPDGSHYGECPLCFLPMPIDPDKSTFYSCCSKLVCDGCDYANDINNGGDRCPFCREPVANKEENKKRTMKRIKANDPAAMCYMGTILYFEGDHDKAVEYWTKAAELGDADAHYQLSVMYRKGRGVEKDKEKEIFHLEKAAIGGHPEARYNLGCVEHDNDNIERAVKHFIIAANLGYDISMKVLWGQYAKGNITKEDLDTTLRTHQAALDEMKSPEREAGEIFFRNYRRL